jgi:hypothetical protein
MTMAGESAIFSRSAKEMAGTTGLEPATSAVTGQRSNQLSYVPRCNRFAHWRLQERSSSQLQTTS